MASIYATLSERKLNEENLMQPAGFHDRNTFAVEAMTHYFVTHFRQYVPAPLQKQPEPGIRLCFSV